MAQIRKEIPSWLINGVNKVFTLLNDVESIDDIFWDGGIYTDFTRVGNVLTFSDAPTYTVFVDYESKPSVLPIDTTLTFWDVKSTIWRRLWQKSTSVNFSSEVLQDEINALMESIYRGRVVDLTTKQLYRAGRLSFLESYHAFRISGQPIVTAEVNIGDTNIEMDTTNILWAGYLLIWGDYIKYTSITPTSIEWVSGITMTHNVGDRGIQLYEMPLNYDVMLDIDKVSYTSTIAVYTPLFNKVQYEIIRINGVPLIDIQGLSQGDIVRTHYNQKYTYITDDAVDFPLPDMYGNSVVADIVAGQLGYEKMLPHAVWNLTKWYAKLREMFAFYCVDVKELNQKLRPTPYNKIWRTHR